MISLKIKSNKFSLVLVCFILFSGLIMVKSAPVWAESPKPIVITKEEESIVKRMEREITLDVRDMNVVDIIKFLALKGEFNVVISPAVNGRATVLLNKVAINDALDIVIIANHLAYKVQGNIVQIMTSAEYEAMFGKGFGDKTEVNIVRLKYAKPSYVLAALDNIKSNVGRIVIDEDTGSVVMIDTPEAIEAMRGALIEIERPLETIVYDLKYARADVVADKLRGRIDAKAVGSITADERSNKLIIRAFPKRQVEVAAIIKELDRATREVLVDARVLQIVMKPEYDVGIDWQLDFRNSKDDQLKKIDFKNFYLDQDGLAGSDNLVKTFGQIAVGNFNTDVFETKLRALQKVSDTKILSNPQILVTENSEAKIHIGDTVPYIISTTSGTGTNAITSEDVRFVDVGLKLNVTPSINSDNVVTMRLRPEISTVVARVDSQGGGIPQVNKTVVETTVIVRDGNTIVMGGLRKDDKVHTKKGFPVLMDIPYVEKMFSRTTDSISSTEIVIFITPHIVGVEDDYTVLEAGIKPFKSYSGE